MRHSVLIAHFVLIPCLPGLAQAQAVWPGAHWDTSTPEAQGLNQLPLDSLHEHIQTGLYGHINRMVVVKNGFLVYDRAYDRDYRQISQGKQSAIGCGYDSCPDDSTAYDPYNYLHPTSHPFYNSRPVHTLQSVTKSVAATVIGIALTQGVIGSLDTRLLEFFDDYDLSGIDPRLQAADLEDLLTMRTGIEWHEQDRPLDATNTTLQLERSQDWIQFTLDQPMDAAPGEKWVYNSGGSHLMSQVIRSASGMHMHTFAEQHLFEPLQIMDYHWKKTPKGLADTEGGLYLEADQLAKIGYLYLRGGRWNGQQLLAEAFVEAAIARQVESVNQAGWDYGYQWWRLDRDETDVWAGLGFGGQYLFVLPEQDLIGVINSWNVFGERVTPVSQNFLRALIAASQ